MLTWLVDNERIRLGVTVTDRWTTTCMSSRARRPPRRSSSMPPTNRPEIIESTTGLTPTAILTTHGHWDHIGAVDPVRVDISTFHFACTRPIRKSPTNAGSRLGDGEIIKVGSVDLEIIHTPGHTPGSVCVLGPGVLLTGDTLFPGGPGATRFPHSDFDLIMESLTNRLFTKPDSMPFFPGHGAPSTLGAERPSLEVWQARGW